jgi:hypothetical protein
VPDLWSDLLACLDLRPVPSEGTGGEDAGADVTDFEGRNQRLEYHRVFGGQLLAQFIQIASATCPDRDVKSQHAAFACEGRADEPIRYHAARHHEGRSFATVTITARQRGGVVAVSSICMHASEDGPGRQTVDEVPPVLGPDHQVALDLIPWETRTTMDLNATTTSPPEFEVWMCTAAVDPMLAPAHPHMVLAGVYFHGQDKVGRDAGELCGTASTGITTTASVGQIVELEPDCVLYMPSSLNLDELCRLLAAGINVVTTCGTFHHPQSMDPEDPHEGAGGV